MKKIAKYFFAALATMAAMSCVKELNVEKPVELTGKAYEFTATIGDETKTTLDAETMTPMWLGDRSGNEYITVMEPNNLNTYVAEGIYEPTAEVTFVMAEDGGAGLTGKSVFAVSPAEAAVNCFNNADSVGVTVNYNQIQYAYPETYDPAGPVAVAYNADVEANPHFSFKNASALLKFRVMEGSQEVTSVKFYSLGGEPLAGQMTLMEKGDSSMIVPAKGASNWVEIRGLYESPLDQDVDYYIAVAPALLKKGVGFQFNDGTHVETFTIEKEINIERNKIYDLGLIYYESNVDDKWYLVGNDASASNGVGTFSSMMFQAEGSNLVARNVTFAEKQSFRILNPAKKVSYYANAAGELEADTWIDLTEEASYAYYPEEEGTYDVYVDYVDGVITGVALVTPGEEAPEYLVPEGDYVWLDDPYGTGEKLRFAVGLSGSDFIYAENYDDSMKEYASYYPDMLDPSMEGLWSVISTYTNLEIVPRHATSGEIICQSIEKNEDTMLLSIDDDARVVYHLVRYSNLTSNSVDLYSINQMVDEEGNAIPVLDKEGEPMLTEDGMPIVYVGIGGLATYNKGWSPVEAELSEDPLEFAVQAPTKAQFVYMHYEGESATTKLFDIGITEEDVIRIAYDYSQVAYDSEADDLLAEWADPRLVGSYLTEFRFDEYEIVPYDRQSGEFRLYVKTKGEDGRDIYEYYLVYYSNFTYGQQIMLFSPYDLYVPVEGVEDAYWQGLGIENYDEYTEESVPVGAQDSYWMFGGTYPEAVDAPTTPDGAQWLFNWEGMAAAFGVEELPTVIDLGVASEGFFLAIDQSVLYGGETDFFDYMSSPKYVVTPDPENPEAGKITMIGLDMYGDEVALDFCTYEYYGGTMCHFVCEDYMIDAYAEIVRDPFEITPNGAVAQ